MKRLLILISSLILTTSCSSGQVNQPSQKTYIEMMMKSDKCTNACWLDIEAGMKIERKDAFAILGNYYGSENVYYPEIAGIGWITWDKNVSPLFLEKGYIALTDESQVDHITIIFQNNQIPINDLVPIFGKPEITVIRNKDEVENFLPCGLWQLFYPEIGLSIFVDGTAGKNYVGMMYINEPYPASQIQISKERESIKKESVIDWDERDRYCTHPTPASP